MRSEASDAPAGGAHDVLGTYRRQVETYKQQAEKLAGRSTTISHLRALCVGVAVVAGITAVAGDQGQTFGGVAGVSAVLFVVLAVRHAQVLREEDGVWRMWRVSYDAVQRASGRWHELAHDGAPFQDASHPYSGDLDVFGPGSLFQMCCVAHTNQGQETLARYLSSSAERAEALRRQEASRELSGLLSFRQSLEAHTLTTPRAPGQPPERLEPLDLMTFVDWAEKRPELLGRRGLWLTAWLLPALTLAGFVLSNAASVTSLAWQLPLAAQIFVSSRMLRLGSEAFAAVGSTPGAFARLRPTLQLIESTTLRAPLLAELQRRVEQRGEPASAQMQHLSSVLGWFELRRNGMVYPVINALLLWDLHCLFALERWRSRYGSGVRQWLSTLGEWEALSSLAGLAHDNPDFCFPEITEERGTFEAEGLAHPLLAPNRRVENDVILSGPGSALLVTGSNMSGKSTLLRAMGLALVLGGAGGPVCARRARLSEFRLQTSMRISDSLSAGVSHFYAELEKLRAALDATRGARPVFFLLDEILHGTNSEERRVGARWVITQLLDAGATGAVSTHDWALCELPPRWMACVRTVHLRETVQGGKMTFDYLLREGPVQGGNALRLMRSLGLQVPLPGEEEREGITRGDISEASPA